VGDDDQYLAPGLLARLRSGEFSDGEEKTDQKEVGAEEPVLDKPDAVGTEEEAAPEVEEVTQEEEETTQEEPAPVAETDAELEDEESEAPAEDAE